MLMESQLGERETEPSAKVRELPGAGCARPKSQVFFIVITTHSLYININ